MSIVYYPSKEEINDTFNAIKAIAFDERIKVGIRLDALKFVFDHYDLKGDPATKEYFDSLVKECEDKRSVLNEEIGQLEKRKEELQREVAQIEESTEQSSGGFWRFLTIRRSQ